MSCRDAIGQAEADWIERRVGELPRGTLRAILPASVAVVECDGSPPIYRYGDKAGPAIRARAWAALLIARDARRRLS